LIANDCSNGTKRTYNRENRNKDKDIQGTKTKTEITSTSRTSATYPATRGTNGQIVVRTPGIEATIPTTIPTTPQEATAATHPGAPTALATTTPTAGDQKKITIDQAAIETAPDHLVEEDPATHAITAPPDATAPSPSPTALAALTDQAMTVAATLPNTSAIEAEEYKPSDTPTKGAAILITLPATDTAPKRTLLALFEHYPPPVYHLTRLLPRLPPIRKTGRFTLRHTYRKKYATTNRIRLIE